MRIIVSCFFARIGPEFNFNVYEKVSAHSACLNVARQGVSSSASAAVLTIDLVGFGQIGVGGPPPRIRQCTSR